MDETMIIAWIDGELSPEEAAEVAAAVAADPALAATAEAQRRLRARFAAAFAPIAQETVALPKAPSATILSLVEARQAREARAKATPGRPRWALPGAIAASLLVGALGGSQFAMTAGLSDDGRALALAPAISRALDRQLSGEAGPVRVALSFRDSQGEYCRDFSGRQLAGVACRTPDGWRLRYAAPGQPQQGDYRMAGADTAGAGVVAAMIAGDPLDAAQEQRARRSGWR